MILRIQPAAGAIAPAASVPPLIVLLRPPPFLEAVVNA